jgi:hypothetical protein
MQNVKDRIWKVHLLQTVQQTHSVLFQILSEPKLEEFQSNVHYFLSKRVLSEVSVDTRWSVNLNRLEFRKHALHSAPWAFRNSDPARTWQWVRLVAYLLSATRIYTRKPQENRIIGTWWCDHHILFTSTAWPNQSCVSTEIMIQYWRVSKHARTHISYIPACLFITLVSSKQRVVKYGK